MTSVAEELVAHSPSEERPGEWHRLDTHLDAVGRLTAGFAEKFGMSDIANTLGLFHDVGKATPKFQNYIRESWRAREQGRPGPTPGSAPHAVHGALLIARWLAGSSGRLDVGSGLELAQVVLHHHGKIRNATNSLARLEAAFQDEALRTDASEAVRHWKNIARLLAEPPPAVETTDPFDLEVTTRFLLSALVDADRLDTEAFANNAKSIARARPTPTIRELRDKLRADQADLTFRSSDTPVNRVRNELFQSVVQRAHEAPGTFRLTIPTGGGKTRTALAFALEHAAFHNLERVIVAIPYTSIIEQTADVYRNIFGSDAVLEHHSNVQDDESVSVEDRWARRLPTENWDAPIVVTTTVQLFESLFSNSTTKIRKVHRLAKAVIVLDEAQTLPPHLMEATVSALGTITNERFGSSVVLCTATQPALNVVSSTDAFRKARELAPNPTETYRELARVEYDIRLSTQTPWTEIAEEVRQQHQALLIVNTTADARIVAEEVGPDCLHLSTRMCPAHRRETLREIRERLAGGDACKLVSTQLIEAGVDVDFPVVFRALAPLDSIAQAAGRCNREGKRDVGRVVVFEPEEPRLPPSYRTGTREAGVLLREGANLHDPATFQTYFEALYGKLTDLDPRGIQTLRRELRFESVSDAYRMIEDDTLPVITSVFDPAKVEPILQSFRRGAAQTADYRALQPFIVQVRRRDVQVYRKEGWMMPVADEASGLWSWYGHYDNRFGLEPRAKEQAYVL